jgi:hypothetical protein
VIHLRHVWEIVEVDARKTPLELLVANGKAVQEMRGEEWFQRDVIVKRRCSVCGLEEVEVLRR